MNEAALTPWANSASNRAASARYRMIQAAGRCLVSYAAVTSPCNALPRCNVRPAHTKAELASVVSHP